MFNILFIMLTGVVLGYLCRNARFVKLAGRGISLTVVLMLFILGLSVGSNAAIVRNLGSFGWQAALLALSGSLGSVLAAWLVFNLFFKKGGKQ